MRRGPLLLVGDSASTPPIPRWCNGSTTVFGTVRRGSNPRRGAKPDHRKSDDSAFPHGNRFFPLSHLLIRSMRNARGPSTGFLTFPVAPERQGVRRPPCSRGNGRHRRLSQPGWQRSAKPCMAGFDSRNRLSLDTSKAGRIHAAARVGLRRKEATCWSRRSSSSAFSSHYWSHGRCAASPPSATTRRTADSTTDTPA